MEAECGAVGAYWQTVSDNSASNGKYITVVGASSTRNAPKEIDSNLVVIPFTVPHEGVYQFLAKVNNDKATHNSFWIKVDQGSFERSFSGFSGTGWVWGRLSSFQLTAGQHTLTIALREEGSKLDKI